MQKSKATIIDNFDGDLKPDTIRRKTNHRMIHEMRNVLKISPSTAWRIKMEVPVDIATNCNKAIGWCNDRLSNFIRKGFLCFEIEAYLAPTKLSKDQKDAELLPYWFAMVVHPEGRDPREAVERCSFVALSKID